MARDAHVLPAAATGMSPPPVLLPDHPAAARVVLRVHVGGTGCCCSSMFGPLVLHLTRDFTIFLSMLAPVPLLPPVPLFGPTLFLCFTCEMILPAMRVGGYWCWCLVCGRGGRWEYTRKLDF